MAEQKQYIGGSAKEFGQFHCIKLGLKYSDLKPNEKGYVNLIVGPRKEKGKFGETHSVWVDTFVPTPRGEQQPQPQSLGDGW